MIMRRLVFGRPLGALLSWALLTITGPVLLGAGQAKPAAATTPAALVGPWALHPLDNEAPPPPPPPIYSSYKKNEAPLETISRVVFSMEEGKLSGKAVFAKGIVLKEDNRDVTGQAEVDLRDIVYDGSALSFKAEVEGVSFEASLMPEGKRGDQFKGTWKAGEQSGKLFLYRRK